ncbi:MAG: hypothetical protein ACRAVC_23630 [Trichormus sp.]
MLKSTQIRAVVISLITSTTLLGIGTFTPNSSTNLVAVAQTKQLRPTRLTAKEISQVKRAIPGQKPILDQAFRVNLPDFGNCVFVPLKQFSPQTKRNRLVIYLVRNDRVVYTFTQSSQVQPWNLVALKAVSFLELDFDGPDEDGILVISHYTTPTATSRTFPVTTLYHREKNGFIVYEDISKKLTARRVKTIAEAEDILRDEFQFLP